MKLKPEIKKQWTEALRSGEYDQSTGRLRRAGRFCVYGVLGDLYAKSTNNGIWKGSASSIFFVKKGANKLGYETFLPRIVWDWAFAEPTPDNFNSACGPRPGGRENPSLATLNDTGMTFTEIADIIDREF